MNGRRIADRYVLAEQLGAGGMGVVHRAFDERLGRAVAVKLLHGAAVRDGIARERLIREARAVAVLEHPGIVHVYDVGATDDGGAFLVMELVRGKCVRDLLETSLSLHERLRIVIDAARALAFAHRQGFVHRDIKPDNLMVRDDGRVVVLDFGLAKLFDTATAGVARLTEEGAFVGTPAYLAPEQARREAITAAADQFALAVVAYEIVTGSLPWSGASVVEVIAGILRDHPAPVSSRAPTVPHELDAVLARALAKQAADRFPTIDAFADALAKLATTASAAALDAHPIPPMESARDTALAATVYSTDDAGMGARALPLVGRARELAEIDAAIADLFARRGTVLSFSGEPGIGKTRLAEEAVARARSRGARSGWGRCWEGAGTPPFWVWTEALRALGETITLPHEPAGDDAARFRVLEAIVRAVQTAAAEPIVIVLDDLHWADRGSLLALKLVARSIQRFPVLIVLTYRDVEARLAPDVAGLLSEVGREGRTVPVRGLTEVDVSELARGRTVDLARSEATRLHRATNGNPFFIGEVLGLAAADPSTLVGDQSFPLTDGVREVIRRRVALLPALVRAALPSMVVVGHDAPLRLVSEISGQDAASLAAALGAPAVRDLVVTKQGRIGFAHDLAREALYEAIEPEERVRLHRAVAAALEAQRGDEALAEIAEHLMAADPMAVDARAVEYTERAGRQAARRWAPGLALRHFARARAARELRGETRSLAFAELLMALADAYIDATLIDEGRDAALAALALAQELDAPVIAARASLTFARPRTMVSDAAFCKMLETAIAGLGGNEPELRCRLVVRLAGAMQPADDPEVPLALVRRTIAEARLLGPDILLAVLESSRTVYRTLDDVHERLAVVEEMCALADRLEHRAHALEARLSLVHLHLERGDRLLATRRAEEHLTLARAFPMPAHLAASALIESMIASLDGKFAEADAICARAMAASHQSPSGTLTAQRAVMALGCGAPETIQSMIAMMALVREPARSSVLAALHARLGNHDATRAAFESSCSFVAERGWGDDGLSEKLSFIGLCAAADTVLSLGDLPRAAHLHELLAPHAERHVVWAVACAYEGSLQLRVGLLALMLGRDDEAIERLEAAIVANTSMRTRPWIARAEHACAMALRKRGRPADVTRAIALEHSALATYEDLHMTLFAAELRAQSAAAHEPDPLRSLVGRTRELAEIDAAIADLFARRGSVLSFAGEPGIGKTRLAEEAVARARSRGARSGWGRCWEGAGAPPYWAWTEALRALGQTIAESPRETDGDDDAARFRVLEGIVRAVQAAGAEPVVIVLDDLHWADRGSVLALKLVARSIQRFPVLVIVTYRDVEARLAPELAGLLSDVGREGRTVPVRGLTESDVAELARSRTIELAAPEMARLHRATNGNPFFVGEVLGLAVADPSTLLGDTPGQSFPLSDGVREVIRRRVALLPALVRAALPAMVVVGHDASLRLVAEIAGQDAAVLAAALAAPVVRDLVVTKQGRIGFAHDLAREALYESIEPEERVRLHRAAAAALEAQRGDDALAEIAEHLMAADPMALDVRAVEYTERAGHQAARRWASDLAARHFSRAVAAREERGEAKGQAFAELLVALADAYVDATLVVEGRAAALRAFELAQGLGAPVLAARATLAFGRPRTFGYVDPAFLKMLETAIAGLGTEEPALRCRLRARLAGAMQPAADPEAALALARASIAEARLLEPEVLLAVLESSRLAYRNLDDIDERLAIAEEMCSLADRFEHRAHALEARFSLFHIHFERGDRRAANERADEYRALVRAFPMPVHVGSAALVDSMFACLDGKFAEADAICATVPTGPTVGAFVPALPHRVAISRAWGSPEALARSIAGVSGAPEPMRSAILTALNATAGNREGARAALDAAVMRFGPEGLSERTSYIGRLVLADGAAFLEDVPRARILYELLAPMAERHAVWVPTCVYEGSIQHRVGLLASVLGKDDEAVLRLEAAIVANASMGSRPWVARAEDACATVLRKRGRSADLTRAAALERSALATYESFGMTLYAEAVRARLAAAPEPAREERPPTSSRAREAELLMEPSADGWTISYGDETARLRDADGLHYLAALVARPEVEIHVLELLAARGRSGVETGDAGPALDARAKAAYKERLEDLTDRLEEAERFGDTGKAERAEAEMAAIKAELARAVGLGGRDRKTGASAERARVNVTLRIKKALEKIDAVSPALGHQLKARVKTGVYCVYRPPPWVRLGHVGPERPVTGTHAGGVARAPRGAAISPSNQWTKATLSMTCETRNVPQMGALSAV